MGGDNSLKTVFVPRKKYGFLATVISLFQLFRYFSMIVGGSRGREGGRRDRTGKIVLLMLGYSNAATSPGSDNEFLVERRQINLWVLDINMVKELRWSM